MPIELGFILERLAAMAEATRAAERQPWKAAHEGDLAWLGGAITKHYQGDDGDVKLLIAGVIQAFAGWTVEAYAEAAGAYMRDAPHPTLGRALRECGYAPMVELLRYLEENGFTCYIASGGNRDFMRTITHDIYGIPPERIIGSSNGLRFQEEGDGGSSSTSPSRTSSTTGPSSRSASGAASGADRSSWSATRTATSRSCASPVRNGPRCGCSCATTTRSASSTTPPAPEQSRPRRGGRRGWTVVSVRDDWATVFA